MGVNTFTFDGVSSDTYGMYITEGASYNAPERAVEMLQIPGRNGHFALDLGRFENVEVTYRAFIDGSNIADYAANLSDLRNWLCSKVGYVRLSDSYNPNEYRMAVYKSGLEVDATSVQSGEFDIVFDCKPQRWLTSGETATSIADGGTVTNPTLFDSSPLLEVEGYGSIQFNGYEIEIDDTTIGRIALVTNKSNIPKETTETINNSLYRSGDTINIGSFVGSVSIDFPWGGGEFTDISVTSSNPNYAGSYTEYVRDEQQDQFQARGTLTNLSITAGTAKTESTTISISFKYDGGQVEATLSISVVYTPNIDYDTIAFSTTTALTQGGSICDIRNGRITYADIVANSTADALGHPTYIDCDIGECYMIKNNEIISLNQYIDLGSDLPTLPQGTTTVNYDNTITDLKIAPRWWKV